MENQRLRNLTTGRLHTNFEDIVNDIKYCIGEDDEPVLDISVIRLYPPLLPWLREKITDPKFWDGKYDTEHVGTTPLEPMNPTEQKEFYKRMAAGK